MVSEMVNTRTAEASVKDTYYENGKRGLKFKPAFILEGF